MIGLSEYGVETGCIQDEVDSEIAARRPTSTGWVDGGRKLCAVNEGSKDLLGGGILKQKCQISQYVGTACFTSFVRTAVKLRGSVSTRCQARGWAPELVHPLVPEGDVIWYANADAEKTRKRAAKLRMVASD